MWVWFCFFFFLWGLSYFLFFWFNLCPQPSFIRCPFYPQLGSNFTVFHTLITIFSHKFHQQLSWPIAGVSDINYLAFYRESTSAKPTNFFLVGWVWGTWSLFWLLRAAPGEISSSLFISLWSQQTHQTSSSLPYTK